MTAWPTDRRTRPLRRTARGGTLVLGGGFGGANVARLLGRRGATVVSTDGAMLFTPLLPEVAAGAIEPRHVAVPLRTMCPHAEVVLGRAVAVDEARRTVLVETEVGSLEIRYQRLVVALGSTTRMLPVPGLAEHAFTFKDLGDAIRLRNHVLRRLDLAEADPAHAERHLTFVVVGAGYAGVEALAELKQLVDETARHYPALAAFRQRWVLVNAGESVLAEVPGGLGGYAERQLRRQGVEVLASTTVTDVGARHVVLSDGRRIPTDTVVWTAGVVPNPVLPALGLPLDDRGRVVVDASLRVRGRSDVYALGDCAAVPNAATPGRTDPPTCQHALRQARRLVRNLRDPDRARPYAYRSLGQGATLGRDKGLALVLGLPVRGLLGAVIVRWYHLQQVPLASKRLRVLADNVLSAVFARDYVELGSIEGGLRPQAAAGDELGRAA